MYTLVGSPATRAFRVMWCLEELGENYEMVSASPRSEEIKKHNPAGKVPALLVDDEVILDSVAIIQFLADRHEKLTFKPGTIERARQDSWTHFALDELDSVLWTAARHSFVLPEEMRIEAIKPVAQFEFEKAVQTLETRLGDNQFVMGDTFTIADIVITHCINWAEWGYKWPVSSQTVSDYLTRTRARPAFQKVMEMRKAASS